MFIPETMEKEIGKNRYTIKALPADYGLDVMGKLQMFGDHPPSNFMKELVLRSVTVNNIQPTEEWFNKNFSKNYKELIELVQEIILFNFGEEGTPDNPNGEGVTTGG